MTRLIALALAAVLGLSVTACTNEGGTMPANSDNTPRPAAEARNNIDHAIADIVGALSAHAQVPHVDREPGRGSTACSSQHPDWRKYSTDFIRIESDSFARDWATLEPQVNQILRSHGFTIRTEMPANAPERYLKVANNFQDVIDLSVKTASISLFGNTSCYP